MKTRMTSFKKAKLNKSDGQTNIENYKAAANKILPNFI